ncbi:hypothetical protein CENSYa_1007 [Cenarchaeum symbiosum A]|uniref:Uncharacterized protein n=1 Tax=Cenarchaeum symbiosum (strain A) TaxID=414004 RepID=A0RWC2_CENSY|nr:hypothetical protein CENSYa_1007 [Cenarchaeum symbiosum A]
MSTNKVLELITYQFGPPVAWFIPIINAKRENQNTIKFDANITLSTYRKLSDLMDNTRKSWFVHDNTSTPYFKIDGFVSQISDFKEFDTNKICDSATWAVTITKEPVTLPKDDYLCYMCCNECGLTHTGEVASRNTLSCHKCHKTISLPTDGDDVII